MSESLEKVPEISFIDDMTADQIMEQMKADYAAKYLELTGSTITLRPADEDTLKLYAISGVLYQLAQYIDRAGKSNTLKYSYGTPLENLVASKKVFREPASAATTTLRFTLSAPRGSAVSIPLGTRVTNAENVYFQTTEYAEVAAGDLTVDIPAVCSEAGEIGNAIPAGALATLVDPIAYVAAVTNTVDTQGGADIEDDDSLRERAFIAPSGYSTAGPEGAYEYLVNTFNNSITDIKVVVPSAGVVNIYFLMDDGSIPSTAVQAALLAFLDNDVRPMTDQVEIKTPTEVSYNLTLEYFVNTSDSAQAVAIQAAVNTAVSAYAAWQRKIGRDINPSELTRRIVEAGAKRVTITEPVYTVITSTQVAKIGTTSVTYGGLEDD